MRKCAENILCAFCYLDDSGLRIGYRSALSGGMNGRHMRRTFLPEVNAVSLTCDIHNDPNQFERRVTRCSEMPTLTIVEIVSLRNFRAARILRNTVLTNKVHSALRNVTVNFHSRPLYDGAISVV